MAGRFNHEIPASLAEIQNNIGTLGRMPTVGISGGQDINPAISETKITYYCVFLSYEDRRSHSVLPCHLQPRNAQRTDRRHDKPSASSPA